jgi:hypothetical protein
LKHTNSTLVTYKNFVNHIQPLFTNDEVLLYELVDLKKCDLDLSHLEHELKLWESGFPNVIMAQSFLSARREQKRRGVYLAQDPYGLRVKDMSAREFHFRRSSSYLLIQKQLQDMSYWNSSQNGCISLQQPRQVRNAAEHAQNVPVTWH